MAAEKNPFRDLARMLCTLIGDPTCRRVTKYLSPKITLKATRKGKPDRRDRHHEFIVTFGRPNYMERKFISACKRAREPFPVKRIQVQTRAEIAKLRRLQGSAR